MESEPGDVGRVKSEPGDVGRVKSEPGEVGRVKREPGDVGRVKTEEKTEPMLSPVSAGEDYCVLCHCEMLVLVHVCIILSQCWPDQVRWGRYTSR